MSTKSLQNFYHIFTSGLNLAEIERLVKVDTRGMYSYYVRSMERPAAEVKPFKRFIVLVRNLFVTFLLKLTPARRLLYAVALILFLLALIDSQWSYAFYAFAIVNFLLAMELADKLVAKDELAVAREIQLGLQPPRTNIVSGYEVASFSDVARSVGGDYYDLIPLQDDSTLAVVGDVSGKGISAALYMVKVQTLLQLFAKEMQSPCELLGRLNEHLCRELRRNYFLTIAIARIHPDGAMQLCRAGHTPALFYDSVLQKCVWLEPKGAAIGLRRSAVEAVAALTIAGEPGATQLAAPFEINCFEDSLETETRSMRTGDVLLLFTDGVTETFNTQLQEFGENRVAQVLARHAEAGGEAVKQALLRELALFRGGAELHDDLTFVAIRRTH